jgi:hypothetical protein
MKSKSFDEETRRIIGRVVHRRKIVRGLKSLQAQMDDAPNRRLGFRQKVYLTEYAHQLLGREWFPDVFSPPLDHFMVRLLLSVYFYGITGNDLWKKEAWVKTGLADIKTARKYIARAKELGLITFQRAEHDRRIELLVPSKRLIDLVEIELVSILDEIRELVHLVLEEPLPDTGTPLVYCPDSPELSGLKLTRSVGRGGEELASQKKKLSAKRTTTRSGSK